MSSENLALLDAAGLSKRFGGLRATTDVDIRVERGEIVSVIGPNGAGKTTLFNLLTGFSSADTGTVKFDGRDITKMPAHQRVALGMARTFQLVESFQSLTVRQVLTTAALLHHRMGKAEYTADGIIEMLGLEENQGQLPSELPLPSAKLLELGKCLATEPKLILLDEMMSGLTMKEAETPISIINRLSDEGVSFLLVEHVMPIIMSVSHRVAVLSFGEKICDDTPERVAADARVQVAYLGGDSDAS